MALSEREIKKMVYKSTGSIFSLTTVVSTNVVAVQTFLSVKLRECIKSCKTNKIR